MSRGNVIFDWLIATCPRGFMRGSSAANHPGTTESFTVAHERAGHTVTRLTYQEARDRLRACRAPARELYYAPRAAIPITEQLEAETKSTERSAVQTSLF